MMFLMFSEFNRIYFIYYTQYSIINYLLTFSIAIARSKTGSIFERCI